jgi:thiamine biosynthesis lipoprotein ApbE
MMDHNRWKLMRRAAACAPLALTATQINGMAQVSAIHGDQTAGSFTFYHEHVLGTSLELKVRAVNLTQAHRAEAAALAEIDRQDRILSAWRQDSEFSRWVATRFQPVPVSPELFSVLAAFEHWRQQTEGALDPSAEAAIRLWRTALAEGRQPSQTEIAEVREAMAQQHWQLDATHQTATRITEVPLALASFAKSYVSSNAADAAMSTGISGVMINIGGDIVLRGNEKQVIDITDPLASGENDIPLDRISVRDRAVATSGRYRRSVEQLSAASQMSRFSHIIDPRTAQPVGHVLSSTVIAPNAKAAGALATAFSVLSEQESAALAQQIPGVDYLLVTSEGRRVYSPGWASYQLPGLHSVAYALSAPRTPLAGLWNPAYELAIDIDMPRPTDARYRRPYVAVWIEDADHFPVRTIALWTQSPRYIPELKAWYRDDQMRNLTEGTDLSKTISSATRPAGHYTLKWDGKDNQGKPVKAGTYTVMIEASREHGSYQLERREMSFTAQPDKIDIPAGKELGAVTFDYRKR